MLKISRIMIVKPVLFSLKCLHFIIFVVLFMKKNLFMMTRFLSPKFLLLILWFASGTLLVSQNPYDEAWEQLNNARVDEAISLFEKAVVLPEYKEKSALCLSYLYSHLGKPELSSRYFGEFFDSSKDPYPALYAMWGEDGVAGNRGYREAYQVELLKKLEADPRNKSRLLAGTLYVLHMSEFMKYNSKAAYEYSSRIKNIEDWMMVGPFDNTMNSGFDKDFGPLNQPEDQTIFKSKYGADVQWFVPKHKSKDGYTLKHLYFNSNNSIVFAQTFVQSEIERDLLLKFGYSGSLKLWLNDSLIYEESEHRETEMDYYIYKVRLNKGYNRILVQLGDFEEEYANFTLRLTDMDHNAFIRPCETSFKPYTKGIKLAERQTFFATQALTENYKNSGSILAGLLLAKAYRRSGEIYKAEEILKELLVIAPKNFFVLRELVLLFSNAKDNTNQNKYYDTFQELYPEDHDILRNKIADYIKKQQKELAKSTYKTYIEKYPNVEEQYAFDIAFAKLDQDQQKENYLINRWYDLFPNSYSAMDAKYDMEKAQKGTVGSVNKILENFLKKRYSYQHIIELTGNYASVGDVDKAFDILKKCADHTLTSFNAQQITAYLLTQIQQYDLALKNYKNIVANRPSDYDTYSKIADLFKAESATDSASYYANKALSFYPYSFSLNEQIRELAGLAVASSYWRKIDLKEEIKSFEQNFKTDRPDIYTIVLYDKATIYYKSGAHALGERFILKINDEKAIERFQRYNVGGFDYMDVVIQDAQTIKKNGEKLDAEQYGREMVFTNLEIGDYIYCSYINKQSYGSKSTEFNSEIWRPNSFVPTYKTSQTLFFENGTPWVDTICNGESSLVKTKHDNFTQYTWSSVSPKTLEDESMMTGEYDKAPAVQFALKHSWKDIVQWYSDISAHQAKSDFTIKILTEELLGEKNLTDLEKFQKIYEFVCTNIQYSSIDFRQSNIVPQKASKVYHSRLGDCKDVSTLFVSIAREAGLKAHLILINTEAKGLFDVLLPALDFNHCIVKIYFGNSSMYLELTDKYLPFGHLYASHFNAPILEIPNGKIPDDVNVERLKFNPGYENKILRSSKITIDKGLKMRIVTKTTNIGTSASDICSAYYNVPAEEQKKMLKQALSADFKSNITIDSCLMGDLKPLQDTGYYTSQYVVENEVLKLGSFKSVKIPVTDKLASTDIFDDKERKYDFDFVRYEPFEYYSHEMEVKLDNELTFVEVPKNIDLTYNGCKYNLIFEKLSEKQMKIKRTYTVNRKIVEAAGFGLFKEFISAINEAENTHLLLK